jgi:hypothetical protein
MRASAPTAFPNLNILGSLAGSFVNEKFFAGVGNVAKEFTNEGKHHELGHYQR